MSGLAAMGRIGHGSGGGYLESIKSGAAQQETAVDFSGLILGFSSAALYYLGEAPIQGKEKPELNLPLAKQNIDIVELLKNKTQGNLSDDETRLVNQVLIDLRLKYVSAAK